MSTFVTVGGLRAELWAGAPPFASRSASDRADDWPYWYVTDDGRRNVLRFPDQPGAVFSDRETCGAIAAAANAGAAA